LREQGIPCVFYPDLYGAEYVDKDSDGNDADVELIGVENLTLMTQIRRDAAHGFQRDYFDHANCIGWTREGDPEHENSGVAVVLSNGEAGEKNMEIGKGHAGKVFIDALGHRNEEITIDENGWAQFFCAAGSVSVWVSKTA